MSTGGTGRGRRHDGLSGAVAKTEQGQATNALAPTVEVKAAMPFQGRAALRRARREERRRRGGA